MKTTCLVWMIFIGVANASQTDSKLAIVSSFVPKGSHICQLETRAVDTGALIFSSPAVFAGSLQSPNASNLAFAYSDQESPNCRNAHIVVLQKKNQTWRLIASWAYPDKYLWSQDGKNIGFGLMRLPNHNQEVLQIITAVGASLGASVEVMQWNARTRMFENIMPTDAEGTRFDTSDGKVIVKDEHPDDTRQSPRVYAYKSGKFKKE